MTWSTPGSVEEYSIKLKNENSVGYVLWVEANLLPGNAPKTAKVFSCLEATWVLRKAKSWERKYSRESGNSLFEREDRCHCAGDKSTITDRWVALSIRWIDNLKARIDF